jgi:hypothetical protein
MRYITVLTVLCLLSSFVTGQEKKFHSISMFGGPTYITSSPDAPDLWAAYGNWGISYGYGSSENGYWRLSIRSAELTIDDKRFIKSLSLDPNYYSLSGGGRTIFSVNIDAIISPIQDTVAFPLYFVVGAGYLSLGSSTIEVTDDRGYRFDGNKDSESALLLNVGLGLRLKISKRLRSYIECVYSLGCTSDRSIGYIPLRIGLSADF